MVLACLFKQAPHWLHKLPNRWTSPRGRKFFKDPPPAKQASRWLDKHPVDPTGCVFVQGLVYGFGLFLHGFGLFVHGFVYGLGLYGFVYGFGLFVQTSTPLATQASQ